MPKEEQQPVMRHRSTRIRPFTFLALSALSLYLFVSPVTISSSVPPNLIQRSEWPHTPFHTSQTKILNALDEPVNLVGINWPGHGLPMVPEGLQYQSIRDIVAKLKDLEMNVVRLTYATEMIDDMYENDGHDLRLKESFVRALGEFNGTRIYEQVVKLNPNLGGPEITRLDVFDAIAEELAEQRIYVHLDNHISKAGWCCGFNDGNGFFGDTYFDTKNWTRGLKFMTDHASQTWSSFISTSLRNELRDTPLNAPVHATYNWTTWFDNVMPAIIGVHEANQDTLIFVSGLEYDRTLGPVISGNDLGGGRKFNLSALPSSLQQKIVWEIHNYNNSISGCSLLEEQLNEGGYNILTNPSSITSTTNIAPIVLTEFGFSQDAPGVDSIYAQCLSSHLQRVQGGWMYWVLVGSYYEREGIQDFDEAWGILSHDWKDWRDKRVVDEYFRPLVRGVLGTGNSTSHESREVLTD